MALYFFLFLRLSFRLLLSYPLNPNLYAWCSFNDCQIVTGRCYFMVSDKDG